MTGRQDYHCPGMRLHRQEAVLAKISFPGAGASLWVTPVAAQRQTLSAPHCVGTLEESSMSAGLSSLSHSLHRDLKRNLCSKWKRGRTLILGRGSQHRLKISHACDDRDAKRPQLRQQRNLSFCPIDTSTVLHAQANKQRASRELHVGRFQIATACCKPRCRLEAVGRRARVFSRLAE
jgi:hypothetical protein